MTSSHNIFKTVEDVWRNEVDDVIIRYSTLLEWKELVKLYEQKNIDLFSEYVCRLKKTIEKRDCLKRQKLKDY